MASSLASVMPGRAKARARCTEFRRADDDDEINLRMPAGLNQQRHVDDRHSPALGRSALEEPGPRLGDRRMNQTFEPLQRIRIAQYARSEALAVDFPLDHDARKGGLDRFRVPAGVELSHRVVGVESRDAQLGEHGRDGRFPHRNRARQSNDDHRPSTRVAKTSASTSARNAGVTVGRAPNQRANPGAAWWSNMPSPSAARRPRALAASMSGVRNGT